jgi:hypothetical protein
MINAYKTLVPKSEGRRPLGGNIKLLLREIWSEAVDRLHLA